MALRFDRLAAGAAAGLLATVPMTALMAIWHRRLPWRSQEPLPPAQITGQMLRGIGLHDDFSGEQEHAAAIVNHFAYGTGMGSVFGALPPARTAMGAAASGIGFGLAVWSASYLGWLPAAGLYRPATEDTAERNKLMIAAHVVWGGSLGLFSHWLSQSQRARSRSRSNLPAGRRPWRQAIRERGPLWQHMQQR
jgi:hypothetical protein